MVNEKGPVELNMNELALATGGTSIDSLEIPDLDPQRLVDFAKQMQSTATGPDERILHQIAKIAGNDLLNPYYSTSAVLRSLMLLAIGLKEGEAREIIISEIKALQQ